MINTKRRLGRKQTYTKRHNNIYLLFVNGRLRITTTNVRDVCRYIETCRIWYKGDNDLYEFYAYQCDNFGHYQQLARESEYI